MNNLFKKINSFSALHALNALVNMSYTFIQLFVFARTLSPDRYAEIVFLTSIGFFILPLSQAIGRANYVSLRERVVKQETDARADEITALIYIQGSVLLLSSIFIPLFLENNSNFYFENSLYLFFCLFTNFWYYELQSTVWAIDLGKEFEKLSFIRRMTNFLALGVMFLTGNLLAFCLITFAINSLYFVILVRLTVDKNAIVPPFPRIQHLSLKAGSAHALHFLTSLMSTVSELVVLNAPYAVLTYIFGIGPAVVIYDTIMKLARLTMMVARNVAEIALPRISRLSISGDAEGARKAHRIVFLLCGLAGLGVAGPIALFGDVIFTILLGHNNIIPSSAGPLAALIVFIASIYQPSTFFLSFLNAKRSVHLATAVAAVGFALFCGLLFAVTPGVIETIWIYAAYFGALTILTAILAHRAMAPRRESLSITEG